MDREKILTHFKKDRFAELAGAELLEIAPGKATGRMVIDDRHLNSLGGTHGAALFTLADFVFAAASNSYETIAVGIQTSMSFVKATSKGDTLTAVAVETSCNPKIATYEVTITDQHGDNVALFSGMVYRKKDVIYDFGK